MVFSSKGSFGTGNEREKELKISVILPVYNVEEYIERCLISFIQQGLDDLELICIDDGSTDSSGQICDDYALQYKEIKVFHQQNKGVGSARSLGLQKSSGDYIAWCAPDDYVDVRWKNMIFGALSAEPDCVVIGLTKIIDEKNVPQPLRFDGYVKIENYLYELSCDRYIKSYLCTHILKSSIVKSVSFNPSLKFYEDYDFFTRFSVKLKTVYFLPCHLYYYMYRSNSLTNQRKPVKFIRQSFVIAHRRYKFFLYLGVPCSKAGYWKTILVGCMALSLSAEGRELYEKGRYLISKDLCAIIQSTDLRKKDKLVALVIYFTPCRLLKAFLSRF